MNEIIDFARSHHREAFYSPRLSGLTTRCVAKASAREWYSFACKWKSCGFRGDDKVRHLVVVVRRLSGVLPVDVWMDGGGFGRKYNV